MKGSVAILQRLVAAALPKRVKRSLASTRVGRCLRGERIGVMSAGVGVGLRFMCGPSNPEYLSGVNEIPIQQVVAKHLPPGAVMYDVGANVGFFSVIAARLVGTSGTVYAFEPGSANASYIRRNARLNGFSNIQVVESAVSSASGRRKLWVSACSEGHALLGTDKPPDAVALVDVDSIALDDFVFTYGALPPHLVKIDVEGAELDVLAGMSRVLDRIAPVVVYEADDADPQRLREKQEAIDAVLGSHGYAITRIHGAYDILTWHVSHGLAVPSAASGRPA